MVTVPINITGGTYKHKSLPLSAQVTRNFWPQLQDDNSVKSQYILESFPGKKLFASISGSKDRGMKEHKSVLYKVTDTTLYSVDSSGTATSLGAIPGSGRCIIDGIGDNIVIVTGGIPYLWNGSTVSTISDGDLETPNGCTHLNNQMIYDGDDGRFASSDVGDATSIDGLNYATAESDADNLIRAYAYDQRLYLLGDKTTEIWWNSGVGNPPFDRIEGGIIPVGLGALHSVAHSPNFLYILGNDNQVYGLQGGGFAPVANKAIAREIATYNPADDAHGMCYNLNGTWMYQLTFPTANKTFAFPEGGEAFELSSGTDGGKDIASSYAFAHRKHLVGDSTSGNIYELDDETYDENGATVVRLRDTGPIHGGLVNAPGKRIEMERFELIMGAGIGLLSGQGSDPLIMLSFSDDGGRTWSEEIWGTVGKIGEFQWKIEWFALGSFYERILRVKTSDAVYYSIHSAAADFEVGI